MPLKSYRLGELTNNSCLAYLSENQCPEDPRIQFLGDEEDEQLVWKDIPLQGNI